MVKRWIPAGILMFSEPALAHGGATGIVKKRMDGMKHAMKTLAPMMQGKTLYDAATVQRAAKTIGRHAATA